MITIRKKMAFRRRSDRTKAITVASDTERPRGRIPRISKLVALALYCDEQLRTGKVNSTTELAHLLRISQPRLTQILNLTLLAPDLLERLLFLPRVVFGRDPIHEKMLRPVVAQSCWKLQRELFDAICGHPNKNTVR